MPTHTPKAKATARKRKASVRKHVAPAEIPGSAEESTTGSVKDSVQESLDSSRTEGSQLTAVQSVWSDRNPELRRQYLAAEEDLRVATESGDAAGVRRANRTINRISSEFVELNIGLALSQARRFTRGSANDPDHVSTALLGLWEAFLRYDPDRGVAFSTFSRRHISGALQRNVRRTEFGHMSQGDFALRQQVRLAETQLTMRLGRSPSDVELATHCGIEIERLNRVRALAATSLDAPVGDGEFTVGDRLPDVSFDDLGPDEEEALEEFFPLLSDVELWAVLQRSGYLGSLGLSLLDVADSAGIGREIIRRVEARAKIRLVTAALTDRLKRIPSVSEIADALDVDPARVEEFSSSSWQDVRTRWGRLDDLVGRAPDHRRERLTDWLHRCGVEVFSMGHSTVMEAAGRYRLSDGSPIGVDASIRTFWDAFLSWDVRVSTFSTHVRRAFNSNFTRGRECDPQEEIDGTGMWKMISPFVLV